MKNSVVSTLPKSTKNKVARIEIRPTLEQKEILEYAAQLRGTTLAAFILANAMEKAENVMESHKSIKAMMEARRKEISEEAKAIVANALENAKNSNQSRQEAGEELITLLNELP